MYLGLIDNRGVDLVLRLCDTLMRKKKFAGWN